MSWACTACTYENDSASGFTACTMCGTMRQEEPPVRGCFRAAGLVADVAAARQLNPDMGIKKLVRLIKMTHPDVSAREVREALVESYRSCDALRSTAQRAV
jgi:rubredoxin